LFSVAERPRAPDFPDERASERASESSEQASARTSQPEPPVLCGDTFRHGALSAYVTLRIARRRARDKEAEREREKIAT
jgi:hypothetical protein